MMSQFEREEMSFERERIILTEIQNNPNSHHNALIKSIVPKYMAKTTFERAKNRLIEKNVLSVSQIGNKKFYNITENYQKSSIQLMERMSHEKYQFLQHEIKRIKNDYHHKDANEKIATCVQLFRSLLNVENGFTFLDSIKNSKRTLYKDEHLAIQEMISVIFHIISDDKDSELVYPSVMSYLGENISKNNIKLLDK
jgi:hypothetical protein